MSNLPRTWTRETVETVCYEIMREIIRVNHLFSSEQFVVYASPAVADYLIKEESHGLLPEIEMFISKQVQVKNRAVLQPRTL